MERYAPYGDMKIFYHTDRMKDFIAGRRCPPVYVRIKPTNRCNQNCAYCGFQHAENGWKDLEFDNRVMIPWDRLERTLLEMKDMDGTGRGVKAITFSGGGDPLTYPHIADALELLERQNIDFAAITNGQALEGRAAELLARGAKWVRVSFDCATGETYHKIRGVNTYEKVKENIRNFAKEKNNHCVLGVNCVISEYNADEVFGVCRVVKELGINNIKLSPSILSGENAPCHKEIAHKVMEQIERAKKELECDAFRVVDKYSAWHDAVYCTGKTYHKCYIGQFFCVIGADSKVYRCVQRVYTKQGEIGDLAKSSFKDIWYSKDVIADEATFDPCRDCHVSCAFDERNKMLDDFALMNTEHVNFI